MSAVEIRLSPRALSREMGAMRAWLDQHRFELSRFSCYDEASEVLVCLKFQLTYQAEAFASRFGGRSMTDAAEEVHRKTSQTGLLPSGMIG
jgi:hypothetical protein